MTQESRRTNTTVQGNIFKSNVSAGENDFARHPCFSESLNQYARIHLPVAPACNIQCRYCLRKYCCANECRPGVTARVMTPVEALDWYLSQKKQFPEITVAGVAGPGDALANWLVVKETLRKIRAVDPEVYLCLSTNGLLLPEYAEELLESGVRFVTVTVNCVEAECGAKLYAFVNYKGTQYRGVEASKLLFRQQVGGIRAAKKLGLFIKINCVAIDGINLDQIEKVANLADELQCDVMNIIPLLPVHGSELEKEKPPSCEQIEKLRQTCGKKIRQMKHCNHCRADAVGRLKGK